MCECVCVDMLYVWVKISVKRHLCSSSATSREVHSCIYMYIYMYVDICRFLSQRGMHHICLHACIHVYIHVCVCIYVCMYASHLHAYMCVYICACIWFMCFDFSLVYTCIYIQMHTHIPQLLTARRLHDLKGHRVLAYTYIHTYRYTDTYTHTSALDHTMSA